MNLTKLQSFALLVFLLAGCAGKAPAQPTITPASPVKTQILQTTSVVPTSSPGPYLGHRLRMVEETIVDRGVADEDVLRAMRTVPRHLFVPQQYLAQAYDDHPLPIGYGQTISQPYIVAWMTELLELEAGDRVLEIGTGSGYQAAVLAELGTVDIYSIEIIPELAQSAAQRLMDLGYTDVHVRQGDGYYGWAEAAPFDAIIVTAAPDHLPAPLVSQLAEGGSIVIPIGPPGGYQSLWRFVIEDNELVAYNLGGVSFVPFTGGGIQQGDQMPAP